MVTNTDLSEFFITKNQANDFIQSLNKIIDKLYEVNFNLENSLANEFGIDKKDKFISLLRENRMNNASQDSLKEALENMQEVVRNLPTVTLTIAFEPNQETLKAFLQWFLFNLNKQVLIDIQVERALIAGATVNCNGKFKDFSVKPLFDEIIKQGLNHNANQTTQKPSILKQSIEFITVGR